MKIKNFGLDAPREAGTMRRILADIEKRAPLPALNLHYQVSGLSLPLGPGKFKPVPCISCIFDDEAFHCAVVDTDPNSDELTMLMTHTTGSNVGFKTTYKFLPQAAVFISYDILKFFYERVPYLDGLTEAGDKIDSPLFRKPLEVENALKVAYLDLPEAYTQALNIKAREKSTAPIIEWKE